MTNGMLRIDSHELSELNLTRLREILNGIEIETYFGEKAQDEYYGKAAKKIRQLREEWNNK